MSGNASQKGLRCILRVGEPQIGRAQGLHRWCESWKNRSVSRSEPLVCLILHQYSFCCKFGVFCEHFHWHRRSGAGLQPALRFVSSLCLTAPQSRKSTALREASVSRRDRGTDETPEVLGFRKGSRLRRATPSTRSSVLFRDGHLFAFIFGFFEYYLYPCTLSDRTSRSARATTYTRSRRVADVNSCATQPRVRPPVT